jgi:hypothetical protein
MMRFGIGVVLVVIAMATLLVGAYLLFDNPSKRKAECVRIFALIERSQLGEQQDLEEIRKTLRTGSRFYRCYVLGTLAMRPKAGIQFAKEIYQCLDDPDLYVRESAANAIYDLREGITIDEGRLVALLNQCVQNRGKELGVINAIADLFRVTDAGSEEALAAVRSALQSGFVLNEQKAAEYLKSHNAFDSQ